MAPSIQFRMPPGWFFKFPPDDEPLTLPPPTEARTFASLFPIRSDIYNGALDYKVPITIATTYAVTVIYWNHVNRQRGNKPFGFSQTKAFKAFVIAHNVFLAVFSALTFMGMIRALAHTWPGREHHLFGKFWPGLRTENGIAGAADALCKMHGPRGFGSFVAYNPDSELWQAKNTLTQLAVGTGLPDSTDVGRLWNEGLAFWGWWFYLSKFYEVFDTFIILAKGKRSSTLQTYHHTGAMMCMWAGIRYMSPPIWMFCFLNSGIHTMMYIYYTLSALSIRVPQRIKRSLTTMQITQFLVGITFAAMHLFVTYRLPVSQPEAIAKSVQGIASSISSGVSVAAATATAGGVADWLKQAALRAAGEEGLAENVVGHRSAAASAVGSSYEAPAASPKPGVSGWETVPCIDTSGQAFAIWLNLAYLAPLTVLFVRFFIKSYLRRSNASRRPSSKGRIQKSIADAAHGTEREIDSLGKAAENGAGKIAKQANGNGKAINGKTHGSGDSTPGKRRVSGTINKQWERFEKGGEVVKEELASAKNTLRKKASDTHNELRRKFEDGNVASTAKEYTNDAVEKLENQAEAAVQKVRDSVSRSESEESLSRESIREEDEQTPASSPTKEAKPEESPKNDMQESWADVAKDTYQYKEQQVEAAAGADRDESSGEPQEERRASTPTLQPTRSLSPTKKSQIPRPSQSRSRERSPAKKAPSKSSSIPRPAAGVSNGTKSKDSTSSSSNTSSAPSAAAASSPETHSEDTPKEEAKSESGGASASENPASTAVAESSSIEPLPKGDVAKREEEAPSSKATPAADEAKDDVSPSPPSEAQPKESTSSSAEPTEEKPEEQDTNVESKQEPVAETSSADEAGREEDLRWRHAIEPTAEGKSEEVKEDVSFAEAVKEGEKTKDEEAKA